MLSTDQTPVRMQAQHAGVCIHTAPNAQFTAAQDSPSSTDAFSVRERALMLNPRMVIIPSLFNRAEHFSRCKTLSNY